MLVSGTESFLYVLKTKGSRDDTSVQVRHSLQIWELHHTCSQSVVGGVYTHNGGGER